MQALLQRGKLPTIVAGSRQSPDEPPIFENELKTLSQDTRDKLSKLEKIQFLEFVIQQVRTIFFAYP